ncbi:MATE family efflux transporter [Streptomyces sp. NPDC056528]|uniref:MATE family efflux transporter n=1 Tax=Streptomyces sp. NPDC056528 TaxID=3345854 RepID=UPI003697819C
MSGPTPWDSGIGKGRLARFAAPLMVGSVITHGTQFVVVAQLGGMGESALYLRAVYAPIAFVFLALNSGLAITLQVLAARRTGAGRAGETSRLLGSVTRVGLLAHLAVGVPVVLCARPIGALVAVPGDERSAFAGFLLAMVLVSPVGLLGELCAAVLRGLGRTGPSLLVNALGAVLTVGTLALLVEATDLGLAALPVSLALAGAASLVVGVLLLRRQESFAARGLRGWDRETLPSLTAVGLPVSASFLLLFVVELVLLRVVAPYGTGAVAGFSFGYTLQALVIVPATSFGSAVAILVNQQHAAGRPEQARRTVREGAVLAFCGYTAISVLLFAAGPWAVSAMPLEQATRDEAHRFMTIVGPSFGCTALALIALTLLEQMGRGPIAIALNLLHFTGLLSVGAWAAHATHSTTGLYVVLSVGAAVGVAGSWPVAWWLLYRVPRRPALSEGARARVVGGHPSRGESR